MQHGRLCARVDFAADVNGGSGQNAFRQVVPPPPPPPPYLFSRGDVCSALAGVESDKKLWALRLVMSAHVFPALILSRAPESFCILALPPARTRRTPLSSACPEQIGPKVIEQFGDNSNYNNAAAADTLLSRPPSGHHQQNTPSPMLTTPIMLTPCPGAV